MKPMKKRVVMPALFDVRGKLLVAGNTVIARGAFPKTSVLYIGTVENLRVAKDGVLEAKIKEYKKWLRNPLKLADK